MAEVALREQVAVVTGASHGIGSAIARRLATMGAHVVLAARSQPRLEDVASELARAGLKATVCPTDVREPEQIRSLIEGTAQRFGRLDILINNAGIGAFGTPLHATSLEMWDAVVETNLRAVYLAIVAAAPIMIDRRYGHIVNISSLAGHNPVPDGAVYAASKWGLNGLTYSVAEELRPYNVRVSVVCPGSVDTDLVPGQKKDRTKMLQPEDVAHVVAMLVTQGAQSFASEVLLRPTHKP
ncbi:MAG: SDR family oxidoreductase [Terriglobales bacterium]